MGFSETAFLIGLVFVVIAAVGAAVLIKQNSKV
jgi:hypothetical protein